MNIYVVDDHPMMREAIAMVLKRLRPGEKIIELHQLDRLAAAVQANGHPDLITLDLNLPDTKGVSGVVSIRDLFPSVPLAVYSASPAADMEEDCIAAGADIYIDKAAGSVELTSALKGLLQADSPSDADIERPFGALPISFSKRQVQLMACLERGLSNRDIATELDISEHTVKVHLWRLFRKVGVKSRTQALHFARNNGLIVG